MLVKAARGYIYTCFQFCPCSLTSVCSAQDEVCVLYLTNMTCSPSFPSPPDDDIHSYLPTLMETMLSALNNTVNLKLKELAVSAIGAIGNQSSHEDEP